MRISLKLGMVDRLKRLLMADRDGDVGLIVRVVTEQGKVHWKKFAAIGALMGISAAATGAFAYLFAYVINAVYFSRGFADVATLAGVIILLFIVKGITSYSQAVMLARVGNRITAENQQRTFDKLLQEGMEFFADKQTSHFTAIYLKSTTSTASVLKTVFLALGRDLLSLISLATVMVIQDPVLSLIGVVIVPPTIVSVRKLTRRIKYLTRTQFAMNVNILDALQETVHGFRVVKAFNLEGPMRERVRADIANVERASNKMVKVSSRNGPMMEVLGGAAIALILLYGSFRILETGASPGEFVSFIGAFLLAYEPAKRIARMNIDLGSSMVNVHLLYDILDSPPTEPDDSHKPALAVGKGGVEFIDVNFGYRADNPVLRNTSFVAQPGKVTALVGPSGGGKSTILSLLLDFYQPQGGVIAIDGGHLGNVSRKSVRANIAYVGQEPFLFRGSIRDNIMCGKPDASEAELIAAAKVAHAHEFITSFPLGYDSPVGEFGSLLSLGQRQRVAVARALIKDAPIVLLDEPTASLDSESEHKVQEAMRRLCAGKTTLVIAHRLNTIVDADCIHVVENGVIVESGRHAELLRKDGRYATFFRLQFRENGEQSPAAGQNLAPVAEIADRRVYH
jgi:ABC-type multidrug transport system fused ATPase/permease subunit